MVDLRKDDLVRYSRQILMDEIDEIGQQKLTQAKVAVVGVGGLGCPVAAYLAAAGVGFIRLIDLDRVEISNLQRQVLFDESDQGEMKVVAAAQALKNINSTIEVQPVFENITSGNSHQLLSDVDFIIHASDNLKTAHIVSHCARESKLPMVHSAGSGLKGQLLTLDYRDELSPCLACGFDGKEDGSAGSCLEQGVLGPMVGMLGCMQALEVIRMIVGLTPQSLNRLYMFDGIASRSITWHRNSDCHCCEQD